MLIINGIIWCMIFGLSSYQSFTIRRLQIHWSLNFMIWWFTGPYYLTHWGRVTHICVGNLTIIGSDNGLSPGWRQAVIWTNAGILLTRTLGTNFSEIFSEVHTFSFKRMHLKMSPVKWRPFCLGLNVLKHDWTFDLLWYSAEFSWILCWLGDFHVIFHMELWSFIEFDTIFHCKNIETLNVRCRLVANKEQILILMTSHEH